MVRHYENLGLIEATRSSTGQRLFAPSAVEQVRHIRVLLSAGLPARVLHELLTCVREHDRLDPCAVPLLVDHLRAHDERIAALTSTRATLQGLIDSATPAPGA
ncbi:DNA-binding transcriptional regulator, MerR family [Streptomyces zhaozhouensis]|uniref:DNA-binding transcriptional regulator, MerR family n=2 Tax=Streptomyces zhaozhouensis TaxID=1300267 RepID=A0A286DVR1_9ACTN|nr:DNA-binding transcriptional regulator, MerR family [Streptomyces zhaozhouensis]